MAITESDVRADEITTTTPTRVRAHRMLAIGAASIVAVAALTAVVSMTDQASTPLATPTSAMSMNEKLQNLVDRGLIPRQALQPAPLTMQEKLQDLVDRGLIPRQALEPASVDVTFGPAGPDFGTPCRELVYTRC